MAKIIKVEACELCDKTGTLTTAQVLGGFEGDQHKICNDCCRAWGYCWSCGMYTTEADGGLDEAGPYCRECNPNT